MFVFNLIIVTVSALKRCDSVSLCAAICGAILTYYELYIHAFFHHVYIVSTSIVIKE